MSCEEAMGNPDHIPVIVSAGPKTSQAIEADVPDVHFAS